MISVGIIGGAGYTAGELIRLLLNHPETQLDFIYSTSNAGNAVGLVHGDLAMHTNLKFTDQINSEVDVLFLCLGHGNSKKFLSEYSVSENTKIIDLSNDFRLNDANEFEQYSFIYGLPELNKDDIQKADAVANPGCFATAIQLALLPLAQQNLLTDDVHVHAVTGATGAGTSLSDTTHFTWRDNNLSYYKPFTHQHMGEIDQSVQQLQPNFSKAIHFLPIRGNFSRGIFATAYTEFEGSIETAKELYRSYYQEAPFVSVSEESLHLKQVVNTNYCMIHVHKHQNQLLVTSIIDNLLKGASGQAVENMNLMFGFEETLGLRLKANYF